MNELENWSISQFQRSLRQSEKNFEARNYIAPAAGKTDGKRFEFIQRAIRFAVFLLLLTIISTAAVFAQPAFRVEGAGVEASPTNYSGTCPGVIKFAAKIQANGKGRVKYTWLRSDGATAPVEYIDFAEAGVRYVGTTWTLGDARVLPNYSGWQQLKILSPNEYLSNKAEFKLTCNQPQTEQQCAEQSRLISWAGKVLGGDGNAVNVLSAPNALTNTLGSMHLGSFGGARVSGFSGAARRFGDGFSQSRRDSL